MQYCTKCRVTLRTKEEHCPLCGGQLGGDHADQVELYPDVTRQSSKLVLGVKCFTFACILTVLICGVTNYLFSYGRWWSLFVGGGVLCVWVVAVVALKKRRNLMKNAIWQMVLICLAFLLWDWGTGWHLWSLDYGVPITISVALVTMVVLTVVKHLNSPAYMIYLLLGSVSGLIPPILLFCGILTVQIPAMLCGTLSLLLLAALWIFQGSAAASELRKILHL